MTRFTRISALLIALCLSLPALGMGLDEAKGKLESAKTQGLVGETATGYLETVKADSQAQAIIEAINKARRDEYARIAEKHDIAVTKVETVAGQKAIEKTPSGQYIQKGDQWVKK